MNREEKSKNSKEKIIQSAFSLFSSKGYDSTSTQDIINLSGLSRGAMYHHFKTKEDILRSVTKELYSQMNNFFRASCCWWHTYSKWKNNRIGCS